MGTENRSKRVLMWLSIMSFYLATVLLHVKVGRFINGLFDSLSRGTYNNIVTAAVLVTLIALGIAIYRNTSSRTLPKGVWLIISYSALSIFLSFSIFFVIHIEAVHFIQYGVLAFLLRKVLPSYLTVAILATLLGAYDELYQYLVLDTRAQYYDFNDIFLDTTGAGLGLLGHWFFGESAGGGAIRKWWQRLELILLIVTVSLLIIMAMMGEFTVNPKGGEPALFTLFKFAPEGFWHYPGGPYARFHILRPIPGLLLITISIYIYGFLDKAPIER